MQRFKAGDYKTLVASHVLNEGVDVPDARIAIILSGTGSTREYIQRLGRVLRKGSTPDKQAILYEVVTEDTSEERTSQRRRGESDHKKDEEQYRQLSLVSEKYPTKPKPTLKAAEKSQEWHKDD